MADPAPPLMTKDSINVAGHKLPLAVVGVVVGIAGLLLYMRQRQSSGSTVAAVGTAPSALDAGSGASYLSGSPDAALANISQQLGQLATDLRSPSSTTAPPPASPVNPPALVNVLSQARQGLDQNWAGVPLYQLAGSGLQNAGFAPWGSTVQITGAAQSQIITKLGGRPSPFYPVAGGYYVQNLDLVNPPY